MSAFYYGMLAGAGVLALAQNLGDYRIDTEFIEYVFDPMKTFILRLFGKAARAKLESKGKAVVADVHAELVNLQKLAVADVSKVGSAIDDLVEKVRKVL